MMTAWVVLHQLPITASQRGSCLTVNAGDVALYDEDVDVDLSSDRILKGETLCEGTLLRGLFVHSSSDYAQLLALMTGMSQSAFINTMNKDALALGMTETHYVDVTGLSPGDLSTAQDQAILTVNLMSDFPVVRTVAALTKVALPDVGVVTSYTPFIGRANVVGVKSGITNAAGGCDVMAIANPIGNTTITTYAVVLGQRAGNPLTSAGIAALALSRSVRSSIARVRFATGVEIEWIGAPTDVVPTPALK
jgi:D-alanyl-D-alanine carboxypeptidase (penicillin-binding protein 5/6)